MNVFVTGDSRIRTLKAEKYTRARKFIKDTGLTFFLGLGQLFRPQGIPVLAYHSIDRSNSYLSIFPEIFDIQMSFLKAAGWQAISLNQLMTLVESKKSVSEKIVVLTFDDGLKNFHEAAWPALNRYGFSATIFVPTDFIGGKSWWYADYALKPLPMLDWKEIRQLAQNGIDVQSHGCSHRNLTDLAHSDLQQEVRESKEILEQGLGKSVDLFCYPNGELNRHIIEAVKNVGYNGATGGEHALYKIGDDPYMIKRQCLDYIAIEDKRTALLSIKACVQGTFGWYVRAKRRLKGL